MSADSFVAAHRLDWQRLEDLLRHMRGGRLHRLSDDDVLAFGHLYRQATSDLAVARRDFPYDSVTSYLNGLVSRAHPFVYRAQAMDRDRVFGFYAETFPRAFRATLPFTSTALLLSVIPALICFVVTLVRPDAAYMLLPGVAERLVPIVQHHHLWVNGARGSESFMSAFIMTNNMKVALTAFAGGLLLGLLTVYILIDNGIMIGTLAGVVQHYGMSLGLWSFVAAHGVIELSVIFISGGCGLQVAWAILHPGLLTRAEALRLATRRAMILILGAVPLLVIAGVLEGFLSPSPAPALLKLAVSLLTGALLYTYLLTVGRARHVRRRGLRLPS